MLDERIEGIAKRVVHCGFRVHSILGPGLLESVYEVCFCHELKRAGLSFRRQLEVPVVYDGMRLEAALKIDVLVEDIIVCELKAVEFVLPVHRAQLLSYLRLTGRPLGFLINFHVPLFKQGIQRFILDDARRTEALARISIR